MPPYLQEPLEPGAYKVTYTMMMMAGDPERGACYVTYRGATLHVPNGGKPYITFGKRSESVASHWMQSRQYDIGPISAQTLRWSLDAATPESPAFEWRCYGAYAEVLNV